MAAGGITVPAYTTALTSDHRHVLTDCGAVGAIVSTQALADRLLPAVLDAPACKWVIEMPPVSNVTPLPISATGASPSLPPFHFRTSNLGSRTEPWATPSREIGREQV